MSEKQIRFLATDAVLALHAIAIEDQGGNPALRDGGLLDSALAQPAQRFDDQYAHPDIPSMAAAYAFHLCKNHPFIDGNKRIALAAMLAFLTENDWKFDADHQDTEDTFRSLASGALDKAGLTKWVNNNVHEKPSLELRDFFAKLTLDQINDLAASVAASGSEQEVGATVAEAVAAIPSIGEFARLAKAWKLKGESDRARALSYVSVFLTAIYRHAEDMGYEW